MNARLDCPFIQHLPGKTKAPGEITQSAVKFRIVQKDDLDNVERYRALSILHGIEIRDGTDALLDREQASDVLKWAGAA